MVANRAFVFESESWIALSISTLTIRRTNGHPYTEQTMSLLGKLRTHRLWIVDKRVCSQVSLPGVRSTHMIRLAWSGLRMLSSFLSAYSRGSHSSSILTPVGSLMYSIVLAGACVKGRLESSRLVFQQGPAVSVSNILTESHDANEKCALLECTPYSVLVSLMLRGAWYYFPAPVLASYHRHICHVASRVGFPSASYTNLNIAVKTSVRKSVMISLWCFALSFFLIASKRYDVSRSDTDLCTSNGSSNSNLLSGNIA